MGRFSPPLLHEFDMTMQVKTQLGDVIESPFCPLKGPIHVNGFLGHSEIFRVLQSIMTIQDA